MSFIGRLAVLRRRLLSSKIQKTPPLADSITQGILGSWEKNVGDMVEKDDVVAQIETDKVTIPINSPIKGVLDKQFVAIGGTVDVGSDLYSIDPDAIGDKTSLKEEKDDLLQIPIVKEKEIASAKEDKSQSPKPPKPSPQPHQHVQIQKPPQPPALNMQHNIIQETMSPMRLKIGERMKLSQNSSATLTTFNEVDLTSLIEMKAKFQKEITEEKGIKLGFMGFFIKACASLLDGATGTSRILNSHIEGSSIIHNKEVDISVAVATPKGLVTPVIRGSESKSIIEIEGELQALGGKAKKNEITMSDLQGGTFTISNGGVFGSLMGTPILNYPQSAILGMHTIKRRPVAVKNDKGEEAVQIRPMMYLALSYDHRIIDGREAVEFLVKLKSIIEEPTRLLLLK